MPLDSPNWRRAGVTDADFRPGGKPIAVRSLHRARQQLFHVQGKCVPTLGTLAVRYRVGMDGQLQPLSLGPEMTDAACRDDEADAGLEDVQDSYSAHVRRRRYRE